jgi:hypothetical protein
VHSHRGTGRLHENTQLRLLGSTYYGSTYYGSTYYGSTYYGSTYYGYTYYGRLREGTQLLEHSALHGGDGLKLALRRVDSERKQAPLVHASLYQ